ncbi:MAG: CRISPR-associated helicase Cas3' [Magnetococcales bacterium]|nr:CRISPR-associated helicase Cas3' [Magnetococcales bacterium]
MFKYWAKYDRPSIHSPDEWHPLVCHGLDVAASGLALLRGDPRMLRFLTRSLAMEAKQCEQWLIFFLALHDVGKFSESFQHLNPDLLLRLQGKKSRIGYSVRHDTLGYHFWQRDIGATAWPLLTGAEQPKRDPLEPWIKAVCGHHGKPPEAVSSLDVERAFTASNKQAAKNYVAAIAPLLLADPRPIPLPNSEFRKRLKRCSWWLAGLAVLADWIGSSRRFFPFHPECASLASYWELARNQAEAAVAHAGLLPAKPAAERPFAHLFPQLRHPSPLQQAASTVFLDEGPGMYILEDMTGAGKTEAAMTLVHRLLAAGLGNGLYVALPTMATANAMYLRLVQFYQKLFADRSLPSLVLAHGARDLLPGFRQSILGEVEAGVSPDRDATEAAAHCVSWLADHNKKALLAQVGVGTIDQALLAVLHARHQSLRLLGLFGKVLVIDEVHANDTYMHALLRTLIKFHAASGGSVILLSATLTHSMRQELADSFGQGIQAQVPLPALQATDYPLLTHISRHGSVEHPVAIRPDARRQVRVTLIEQRENVLDLIKKAALSGQCVCWIRNTVADARDGYRELLSRLDPEQMLLFHARFTMGDRLAVEERVLATFGIHSGPEQRRGRVLVATQVVEQSLDLDFDVLISDLAPIDLLIQRAGRLHRHRRHQDGTRCDGPDERGPVTLLIHGPLPQDDVAANWYQKVFPGAAAVYPDHAGLWLTARLLREQGGWVMPDQARELIEKVFSEDGPPFPAALMKSRDQELAKRYSQKAQGMFQMVELEDGYTHQGAWGEDHAAFTRLGAMETVLRLARWDQGRLSPWCDGTQAWAMSQVKIHQVHAMKEDTAPWDRDLEREVTRVRQEWPDQGKTCVLVPMVREERGLNGWHGSVLNPSGQAVSVYYHPQWGLMRKEERE